MTTFTVQSPLGSPSDVKESFNEYAKTVDVWVGHNIISYDIPHINRLLGTGITVDQCVDTLVLSRLFRPVTPERRVAGQYNREWGHGLAAWGRYLGFPKIDFHEFDKFSQVMLDYCVNDVALGVLIYQELKKESVGLSEQSIRLEHDVAAMLNQQVTNGFYLDRPKAEQLRDETSVLLEEMDEKLQRIFPPVFRHVRDLQVKTNKDGTPSKVSSRILEAYQANPNCRAVLKEDGSYSLEQKHTFNPQSGGDIAERLQGLGWSPKRFTDKGSIKTDKSTLQEAISELLERPTEGSDLGAIRCLSNYAIVANRHDTVLTWLSQSQDPDWGRDGRVHGGIIPIGAGTHRCAHHNPNMANIARVSTDKEGKPIHGLRGGFGWDCRDCWSVPPGRVLVGADAAGIQLRALAHYMNDQKYTDALLKSDIHVVNQKAAGISTRAIAKTFIYSWLMGGGDEKIGSIVGVKEDEYADLFAWAKSVKHWNGNLLEHTIKSLKEKKRKADRRTVATIIKGHKTKENFLNRTPALKRLKKTDIPEAAKRGYLIGLDGRKIWIPNEHLAMSIYLQGFEAVIMKQAMKVYHEELVARKINFKQCSFTHDEFQVETDPANADIVGQAMVKGIVEAGKMFGTNCPLDGEYKVGTSWAETH